LQDLAQLDRELSGMALEAPVCPREDDGLRPEPLGQPQPTGVR
jgi:hypothetical protein